MSPVPAQMVEALEILPPALRNHARDYFCYAVDFLPLAATTQATQTVQIQADSDFLLMAVAATARDPAAPATVVDPPPVTVELRTSGSGRFLQNRAMDWDNVFGSADLPFLLPFPKYLDANSTFDTILANLDAADDFDIRVSYHGFKVFDFEWGAS